jgi:hypothetical protein
MKYRWISLIVIAMAGATFASDQGAKPNTPPKQGAVQMPGDNGKVGTPYMLGKKGEELVFTLEKAEFASRRMPVSRQRSKGWWSSHMPSRTPERRIDSSQDSRSRLPSSLRTMRTTFAMESLATGWQVCTSNAETA